MQISILTYNLFYNKALKNLDKIIFKIRPDIITLQEIETSEDNLVFIEKLGYKLADYSNSFLKHHKIYGIATFYNPDKLAFKKSASFNLPRGFYEILLFLLHGGNNPRTVLNTEFVIKTMNKAFMIYNLHLTAWGTNGVRMKQIKETFQTLEINSLPCIISGDFNFTYGRKQFEMLINKYNLKEATANIFYTLESKILRLFSIKLKLDYILYQKFNLIKTQRIETLYSDHFPILSIFDI